MVQCASCNAPLNGDEKFCGDCGAAFSPTIKGIKETATHESVFPKSSKSLNQPTLTERPPHNPVIALLLSIFCLYGGGQIYNRQYAKGILVIVICTVVAVPTKGISGLILLPLSAVDAFKIAKKIREGCSVTDWEWF